MKLLHKILVSVSTALLILAVPYAVSAATTFPVNGGTGSTTLSGILLGQGTSPVHTLGIGTGLSLSGGILTNTVSNLVSSVFGRTGAVVATTGDYTTAQVTEVTNLYFTASRVLATTLTGFVSGAGTVSSSDTVLSAIDKLDGNIGTKISNITGLVTQGTNVTITGSGTSGSPYVVNATSASTPGGLNLQVQYNNAGAFGGISGAVTNGTILNLTNPLIGGATITTSSVNGVTLTTGGSATTFLNGAGSYTTPSGSSFSYPFPASATSSPVAFNGGLTASTLSIGSLTGTLNAAGGVVYSTATSTITTGTGIGYSGTMGSEIGGISGTLTNTGVTSIVAGTNISISGATGAVTISSTGGSGTSLLTNVGANTFLNTGTNLQAPVLMATSTTATSTFAGDVVIGGKGSLGGLPNPYLFIGTSTNFTPLYGRVAGDLIDAEDDFNGVASINVANANIGSCAASTYFADGNNPTLGGYYTTLNFYNDGFTNGGGAGCGIGASNLDKAEGLGLNNPTGEEDFNIASTSQNGFADFNWNVNNVRKMTLTNGGNLGVGSSSPAYQLVVSTSSVASAGQDIIASFNNTSSNGGVAEEFGENFSGTPRYADIQVSGVSNQSMSFLLNGTVPGSLSGASVLSLVSGASNAVTGISITNAATGGTTAIVTTDSGAASSLTINAKGSGTIGLGTVSTGTVTIGSGSQTSVILNTAAAGEDFFRFNGSNAATLTSSQFAALVTTSNSSAVTSHFQVTGAADTTLTGATEAQDVVFNLGQIRSHASGAIATQRDFRIIPSTHTFTAGTAVANATIASTSALSIDGPPGQGALANYTNAQDLFLGPGGTYTSSTTNASALVFQAPTGATNNWGINGNGRVSVTGLTTSASTQSVIICGAAATGGELIAESIACVASAARYKMDVQTLTGSLAELMQLRPVSFKWKADFNKGFESDPNKTGIQYSLIADEVQKVDPNLVIVTTATTTFEGVVYPPGTIQGLQDSNHWAGFLVDAIQEQQAEIENLKSGTVVIAKDAQDKWQDICLGLLVLWNIYLTIRKRK